MSQDEPRVIVVDPGGRVYPDAEAAAMRNRAAAVAQAEALRTGVLTAQDVAAEADYAQPTPVNRVPVAIVPFTFQTDVRPETLNANFSHLGNIVASLIDQTKQHLAAINSLTDRLDRITVATTIGAPNTPSTSQTPGAVPLVQSAREDVLLLQTDSAPHEDSPQQRSHKAHRR